MISVALGLAAVISVLAFGGVDVLKFLPAELIVCITALTVFWKTGRMVISRSTAAVIGVVVAVPLLQLVPFPRPLLAVLSPAHARLISDFRATGIAISFPPTLTVESYATGLGLLRLICYILVFLLAGEGVQAGNGRKNLPKILIGIGLAESAYGLVQYLAGWQYIYTYPKTSSAGMASGTYVNYNHFAGLLEMVLPFLIVELWFEPRLSRTRRAMMRDLLAGPTLGSWILHLALLLEVFLALMFSQSRSGIVAGFAGAAVAGFLVFPKSRRSTALLGGFVVVILLLSYSVWIGLAPLVGRFENSNDPVGGVVRVPSRPIIWKDTLSLIRDFPLFGSGLGTYPSVSLHYQTIPVVFRYEHAHNDYLEFAADMGIPTAILLFGGLWALALQTSRSSLTLERQSDRRLAAACAGAMVAVLIHSLTDFNLQIPANALIFSWIAGTAAALVPPPFHPEEEQVVNESFTGAFTHPHRAFARKR